MEIHEITCNADADTLIAGYITSVKINTTFIDKFEEKIEEWEEEFEKLERQIKFRDDKNTNHYTLNKIIGLHFLVPTALFYVEKWKEMKVDNNIPLIDDDTNLRDQYPEEQQRLWDDDSLFDSEEPE